MSTNVSIYKCMYVLSSSVLSDSLWPQEWTPPGSSVHRIFQARILEWFAISYSGASSWPRDWTRIGRKILYRFRSDQSLTPVRLFATPWIAARQASLSITNSRSLLKLMSIESVMPSNYLILCCPLLLLPSIFPSIRVFSNESVLHIRWQSIGVSASASVLPMNIQDWFPLGWTGLISLWCKGLSRVFSNTTVQKHPFFCAQLSLQSNSHIHTRLLEKP